MLGKKTVSTLCIVLGLSAVLAVVIIFTSSSRNKNTHLYYYSETGQDISIDVEGLKSTEEVAQTFAKMYMDELCEESDERSFRITEYKNLSVDVIPTISMDTEVKSIYNLNNNEIDNNRWIVEIGVQYKYEGIVSPIGPSNNEWIDILYQASPVGFLLTKDGNSYSFQSRFKYN